MSEGNGETVWKAHRAAFVFFLGVLLGAAGILMAQRPSRLQSDQDSDQNQIIIQNRTRIENMEHQVRSLQEWKEKVTTDRAIEESTIAADIRELKVISATHDRILWAILVGLLGLLIEAASRVIRKARV